MSYYRRRLEAAGRAWRRRSGTATGAASVALLLAAQQSHAFMYRPATGLTWDPSCMTWEGKTYCYFMYVCGTGTPGCATNETHYGHGLVAVASDGVHFETHSAFNAEAGNVGWFKCMIHKVKDVGGKPMFVMDHGTSGAVTGPDDPKTPLVMLSAVMPVKDTFTSMSPDPINPVRKL